MSERTIGRWLGEQRKDVTRQQLQDRHKRLTANLTGLQAIEEEVWRRLAKLDPEKDTSSSASLLALALAVNRDRTTLEDRLEDALDDREERAGPIQVTLAIDGPQLNQEPKLRSIQTDDRRATNGESRSDEISGADGHGQRLSQTECPSSDDDDEGPYLTPVSEWVARQRETD